MPDKMYYSEQEVIGKLGLTGEELEGLVGEGKLHAYKDGQQRMFKVEEVDAMAPVGVDDEVVEVELTPADTSTEDVVTLSEADEAPAEPGKEDTVITSEGISIFDEEDLEVTPADPMAKTTIAPSVEDQIALDGVGSGSGLLDLTRESDDTSLGAEVLEHIDVESAVPSSAALEGEPAYAEPEQVVVEAPTVVEEIDAGSGAFSGLAVAACLLMVLMGGVVMAVMFGAVPPYLEKMHQNLTAFIAIAAITALVLAAVGYFLGKSVAERAAALQRSGD